MRHPHAEATYKVIPFEGTSFAVEVRIPDTHPTTVSGFATEAAAEKWVAEHQLRVASQTQAGRWHRRTTTPATRPVAREHAPPLPGAAQG